VTFVGVALEKEVYSYLDVNELRRLMPIQNGGMSAKRIAEVCRDVIHTPLAELKGHFLSKAQRVFDLFKVVRMC
jgi:hypothetical protein